ARPWYAAGSARRASYSERSAKRPTGILAQPHKGVFVGYVITQHGIVGVLAEGSSATLSIVRRGRTKRSEINGRPYTRTALIREASVFAHLYGERVEVQHA